MYFASCAAGTPVTSGNVTLAGRHAVDVTLRRAGYTVRAEADGDYVIKPFDTEELLARVAALLRRAGRQRSWRAADDIFDSAGSGSERYGC